MIRLGRCRPHNAVLLCVYSVCLTGALACGGPNADPAGDPEAAVGSNDVSVPAQALSPEIEDDAAVSARKEREDAYLAGLSQLGVSVQSRETAVQLGRGICARIEIGTSESDILGKLESVTSYLSQQPGTQLDSARVAQTFVDAATAELC